MKKRIIAGLLLTVTLIPLLSFAVSAKEEPVLVNADHAYVYNFDHDTVLFTQNENDPIYPGPTVKLMTALLAIEAFNGQMDMEITITRNMLSGVSGNNINLQVDETVTSEYLLNALIVGNSNDAATVIACVIAGSVESFVELMNRRAEELGATHTNYTNPTGMHNNTMYTTVADTAIIAKYLYQYSVFRTIAKQDVYVMPETNKSKARTIYNRNFLIATNIEYKYYSPTVTGMNAGNTYQSGYSVVATSEYNDNTYLAIVMGASYIEGEYYSYYNVRNLLTWAYESYADVQVLSASSIICEIPVSLADGIDHVTLLPEHDVTLYLPTDLDYEKEIKRSWTLNAPALQAPVEKGTVAGTLTLIYEGNVVAEIPLVTKSSIDRSEKMYWLSMLQSAFHADWVVPTIIIVILLGIAYVILNATVLHRGQKTKFRQKK